MMIFRIATGFFIWDVYKWLLVFLLPALLACLAVNSALKIRGGRLVPKKHHKVHDHAEMLPAERFAAAFSKTFVEPWGNLSASPLIGIAALTLLLVIAVFSRG